MKYRVRAGITGVAMSPEFHETPSREMYQW
jgi:hypothetical protein